MNPEARAELDRILALEPAALTDADQAFLTARRDYLTEEQRNVFGLTEKMVGEPSGEGAEPARPRKSRKSPEESDSTPD